MNTLVIKQYTTQYNAQKYCERKDYLLKPFKKLGFAVNQLDEYVYQVEIVGEFPQEFDLLPFFYPDPPKYFIRVEYDPNYTGGDYDKVGNFTYVPADSKDVEVAFEEITGYKRMHIIRYSPDELYGEDDEPED
jgi:hypothetical protein